jgi:N-acetylglucosaminyldiphosphoundecaprenol N-acetyl-beta-D-mannosaminyltransferase
MPIERLNVLGVGVSALSMDLAVATIEGWIADRQSHYVCITGVHGVMESQHDPDLRDIHNHAGLVTPDGMPLVWLLRLAGFRHVTRVYGPDLMLALSARATVSGHRHFYYGGGPGVADLLSQRMQERFPGLSVVGTDTPPFRALTADEEERVIQRIDESGADIVWIGLSTPKQERLMAHFAGRIKAPVMIGVGAAFDFHAGLKKQAPAWMQRNGLEWAFRMASEPKRLAGRYLRNNPLFVLRLLEQQIGLRRYPPVW